MTNAENPTGIYPNERLLTVTGDVISGIYRQEPATFKADRDGTTFFVWGMAPDGTMLLRRDLYNRNAGARAALARLGVA